MDIHNRMETGVLIITIDGRLDASNATVAEEKINKALEAAFGKNF